MSRAPESGLRGKITGESPFNGRTVTVTDDTTLTTAPVALAMHPIAPPYATQFKHLAMGFTSENVLHVELKRSFLYSPTKLLIAKVDRLRFSF